MGNCKTCDFWRETLPGLKQCQNLKSAYFNEDVKADFKCVKFHGQLVELKEDDGLNIMRQRVMEKMLNQWTIPQLASEINVAQQTLWSFLKGNSKVRIDTAIKLAITLGVTLDWLTGLKD